MSFEYNGVVYRDLEPQVRYDAEQIQLLKQADVTINENLQTVNENLQTINTEINGKLTKPTNPSAESAVTMLADGTVGTKLLSEIGGSGGGKLYLHGVFVSDQRDQTGISMFFYTSSNVAFTASTFKDYFRQHYDFKGVTGKGNHMNEYYPSYAYVNTYSGPEHDNDVITYYKIVNQSGSETTLVLSEFNDSYGSFSDTVTEV